MAKRLARETREIYPGAIRNLAADFSGLLDAGETLSSVISVTPPSGAPVASAGQVNSSDMRINGAEVAAGKAVQFSITHAGEDAGVYEYDIIAVSSAGQRLPGSLRVDCK